MLPGEFVNAGPLSADELAGCTYSDESGFYLSFTDSSPRPPLPPPKKALPVSNIAPTVEVIADSVPASSDLLSSLPLGGDGGIPSVQALVGAPADLRSVLPDAGNTSGLTVLMAGIAVLGGGAAWKFYDSHSKRKHEQEMARIERQGQQDDSHKKCDASRAALELRVTEVQARLDGILARLDTLQQTVSDVRNNPPKLDFDADDLDERLSKLEKAFKKGKK